MKTERREAIRTAVALQKFDVVGIGYGTMTVKMDDWKQIVFESQGRQVIITVNEVFKALEEAYGSTKIGK